MAPAAGADRRQGGLGGLDLAREGMRTGGREKGHGGDDSAFLTV
jgi:hypothetical protein